MRSYQQECGVARALDLFGDRWTLMVLRDLCSGPWRFTDLANSLSGMGPNLLSARLGYLMEAGLVKQVEGGYQLSRRGQAVRPLLRELMALGKVLGGGADDHHRPVAARIAMGVLFDPVVAQGESLVVSIRVEEERFSLLVNDGALTIISGDSPLSPDVTLEASRKAFEAAGQGVQAGDFRLRGHASALQRFRRIFSIPSDHLRALMGHTGEH